MSKKKNRKPEKDFLEEEKPRCALRYASISSAVFDTLIEHDASPTAVKVAIYMHFNLVLDNGKTHARAISKIARDLRVSPATVYRGIAELTELEIISEVDDASGPRFHISGFVEMREDAAQAQRDNAAEKLQAKMESWSARFAKKHGRPPTARRRAEEEGRLRRELGLT